MPSPTYSQNKASIMRYRAKNVEKFREYERNLKRQYRAYQSGVKQLLYILNNFFEYNVVYFRILFDSFRDIAPLL
jgi:hypothetical protein